MRNYKEMEYTRAAICVRGLDGLLKTIKVEEKGYPGHTGAMLTSKYQKQEKVEELLDLGDLIRIEEEINPSPNHPHYIMSNGDKEKKKLQERVTVSLFRDYRVNENGILKKQKKQVYRVYKSESEVYYGEGVDYVYVFDNKTKAWETYSTCVKARRFTKLSLKDLNYRRLILNLIDREDIEELTKNEKKYLSLFKY